MKVPNNSIGNQRVFIDDKTSVFDNQDFQWKVRLTHIKLNLPSFLVGVEKQDV